MKCARVPPSRCSTIAPTDRAPWSAAALSVASTSEARVVIPGSSGAISTPQWMPASVSARTARRRCNGGAVPGSSRRHASSSMVGTLR